MSLSLQKVLLVFSFILSLLSAQESISTVIPDTVQPEITEPDSITIHDSSATSSVDSTAVPQESSDSVTTPELTSSDTLRDSAEIEEMRLSLIERLKNDSKYLYENPTSAATIFNPYKINRKSFARDDYYTWSDILPYQGEFTPAYYGARHHHSRALWHGYTLPLFNNRSVLNGPVTSENYHPMYEPLQLQELYVEADGSLRSTLFPQNWVSPQIFFIMENGVFDGNTLELRAMRNLTRYLTLGVSTSYRNLNRKKFTQSHGSGWYNLYRDMTIVDSTRLVKDGINPYSANHITTFQAIWENKQRYELLFRYQDLNNDVVYPFDFADDTTAQGIIDTTDFDTAWYCHKEYNSDFKVTATLHLGDKLLLQPEGQISDRVFREAPVSTTILDRNEKHLAGLSYQGAGTKLSFLPHENDTVQGTISINRSNIKRTNDQESTLIESKAIFENSYNNDALSLYGKIGTTLFDYNDERSPFPQLSGSARYQNENWSVEGWSKIDLVPTVIPFDSTLPITDVNIADAYWGTGLRGTIANDLLSLSGSYSYIGEVDSLTVLRYWQNQQAPYANPGHVFTLTPALGEWRGLSFKSSWSIADTKPYLKSTSRMDIHFHKDERTRHFYWSFLLHFWSEREKFEYLDRDDWYFPIWDLGTKMTAEIKSFRLFMKMDNILNRKQSYVPGYYMPGFIIRWGFAWTITG